MSSGGLSYEEALPAYAEGRPAYGEAVTVIEAADEVAERFDRGKDWPLAFAIFTPVIAAYGAIAYGLYVVANALL
jgi:hypothetical protein